MTAVGKIIVISGPTGSGESAITKRILELFPGMKRIVTTTSRPPRPGEQEGIDYYFVDPEEFREQIAHGDFLEYIQVPNREAYYGTRRRHIEEQLDAGVHLIGNFGYPGHASFGAAFPGRVFSIFIKPDSLSVIRDRIVKRDPTIAPEEVEQRLLNAAKEMEDAKYYDAVVVNNDGRMGEAVEEVRRLVEKFLSYV